ncbi:hypothetical protein Q5424_07945 [Conexibacter sp. JD483]|uniref:hypothetical protein n=1 Tax=unclassified Conexibacter TaxID=2627773 RepID=UPI002718CDC1|nr:MULTISPECIES: hypothetical protein [unclassified Conexibacter]MDO8184747.1 hypothetical protein [Conexibacter sp. CPCC 205706]MDO8196522.1 hypothetical protein [Conexibacter sp. CPCC 205762]MDR9369008.1 hypothetical protein [Conexibacter sp. JD483]
MRAVRWSLPIALVAAVAVVPATATAKSAVRVSAQPLAARLTTRAAKTAIVVSNPGRARLTGLTLAVVAPKGVKVTLAGAKRGKTSRALPALKGRGSARVTVALSRTARGPARGRLTVKVTRGGKTLGSARLAFGSGRRSAGRTGPAQPPADPNDLSGRYFWGTQYTISGILMHTLYFTSKQFVWVDDVEGTWPSCAAASEQCKPYTYDAASNTLTIDGRPAALKPDHSIDYDDDNYGEFGYPAPGTRWTTYVTYANSSGLCPLYCSYYTENLEFRPDGTFIRDAVASGSGPISDYAIVPADSKGTYEVRADRTLRLAFADGRERIETVALYLTDDGRALRPVGDGLLLDGDGYFDIRD